MRGSIDLKVRAVGTGWPAPYRLRYYTGDEAGASGQARLVGWGATLDAAIQDLCADPRSLLFDDLAGHLRGMFDLRPAPAPMPVADLDEFGERPLEVGAKRLELLSAAPDPHNMFAIVQWWPRGEQIKIRAEALALEPDVLANYEAHVHIHRAREVTRGTISHEPFARIIEFCVPSALVTTEVRFFYRTPEALYFFREHNPYTSLDDYDFDIPIEGVTMLL